MATHLDLDVLRSFVAGVDLGSYARAADRLGRSTSALSAQLKKLEEQLGVPVLRKSGRGLVPTAEGELMLSYARRLLALNDAAVLAVRGSRLGGRVRVGLQEDFGEGLLTEVLGLFARTHPAVTVEARIARNLALETALASAELDLILAWQAEPDSSCVQQLPLCWIGDPALADAWLASGEPLPLVVFEAPCVMRSHAVAALDAAGIPWRVAFTSSSLAGIWAAVQAGLGLTVRTGIGKPTTLARLSSLPPLPEVGIVLKRGPGIDSAALARLQGIVAERLAALCDGIEGKAATAYSAAGTLAPAATGHVATSISTSPMNT